MKINKAQLIELLVEKTGMEKQEVEQQLKELIKRIKDAASRGKALEIKNFGLFYFDSDKNLRFDPADSFRTEVNFKYAGMEPVEVKPPRKTTSEQEDSSEEMPIDKKTTESEEEEEDVFGFDDDDIDEEKEKKEIEETESDEKVSPAFKLDDELEPEKPDDPAKADKPAEEDKSAEADKPEETAESKRAGEPEKTDKPEKTGIPEEADEPEDPFKDLLSGISLEPSEQKREEEEIKKAGTRPAVSVSTQAGKKGQSKKGPGKKSKPPQKKKDPIMLVLAVVLTFVVVMAGFFIITDMTQTPPQEPDPPAVTEQRDAVVAEPEPEPADAVEPDTETEQPIVEDTEPEPEPVIETVYGLTGTVVDEANDGFTIVLHSLRNNNNAQAAAENLRDQGYRTIITERTIDGDTVYRVAVGQFPTVREAQDKAAELPEPYRNQNFIQRIQ